ncbi:MAG TPA: hypothetical protein VHA34_04755 [Actinomycetes bacterium]|nr:hypothetical protein [Actinomycetes bacterium]
MPRHRELPRTTARAICKQLGVPHLEEGDRAVSGGPGGPPRCR